MSFRFFSQNIVKKSPILSNKPFQLFVVPKRTFTFSHFNNQMKTDSNPSLLLDISILTIPMGLAIYYNKYKNKKGELYKNESIETAIDNNPEMYSDFIQNSKMIQEISAYYNKKKNIINKEYCDSIKNGTSKDVASKERQEKMEAWKDEYISVQYLYKYDPSMRYGLVNYVRAETAKLDE